MRTFPIGLLALALAACGTTADVMRIDATSRDATDPSAVQVFPEEPSRAYSSIAMVKISDEGWDRSLEELKTAMIKEVAKLGGDAVIVGTETRSAGTVFVPIGNMGYGVDSTETILVGKVIVFSNGQ